MDPGEVFVAAAFVGAFGVVTHVGTDSKLQTLILICVKREKKTCCNDITTQLLCFKYLKRVVIAIVYCMCTSTGLVTHLFESWFAGTEGVGAIGDTVSFVSITALSPVAPTVI